MDKVVKKVGIYAVIVNIFLAIIKILAGLIFKSMALLADGVDTATDIMTSSVMLLTTVISSKPPDREHPFGHSKAQNIGAKTISFVVFYAGVSLLIESTKRLISKNYGQIEGYLVLVVAAISVALKTSIFLAEYTVGKKYKNYAMIAEAKNMRNDILNSSLVFGSIILNKIGLSWMDPLAGLFLSIFIIKVAWEIFEENTHELMDGIRKEDNWIYDEVIKACENCGGSNPHKIRARRIADKFYVDLDIEVDGEKTVQQAHDISVCIKEELYKTDAIYDVVVHIEPEGNKENERYGIQKEQEN